MILAVVGANSMIGSRFCEIYSKELIQADLVGKISVDITKKESVDNFFKNNQFQSVILFSAFTDVDAAEKQRNDKNGSCWKINVDGVKNVVDACVRYRKKIIFLSTDFIFDGKNGPYSEEDKAGPNFHKVSWYGTTKIEGEKLVKNALKKFVILRISYPYRARFEQKVDFAKQILKEYDNNNLYPLFSDQQISPTFIDDVAPCIDTVLASGALGIFHLASPNVTSPYEFGKELLRIFRRDQRKVKKGLLEPLLAKESTTPRPLKGGMRVEKIKNLGFKPTSWEQGIEEILNQSKGQLI